MDSKAPGCINVSKCTDALQVLKRQGGLVFDKSEGELAYLKKIKSTICQILPPSIKFAHPGIQGKDRLCKIIINKFEEMESSMSPHSELCVLGMYGPPGSGKSTLSKCLRDELSPLFAGKVLYLELPDNATQAQLVSKSKELFKLTDDYYDDKELSHFQDLSEVIIFLRSRNVGSPRGFLVIDNISCDHNAIELVETILLNEIIGAGSRVMLVARTLDDLRIFGNHVCQNIRVPSIDEKEAFQVLLQPAGGLGIPGFKYTSEEDLTQVYRDAITQIVRMCVFHEPEQQQSLYRPSDLKTIGGLLRSCGMNLTLWQRQWQNLGANVQSFEREYQKMSVEKRYEKLPKNIKLLFHEVACFLVSYFVKLAESSRHYGKRRHFTICADVQRKPNLKLDKLKTSPSTRYMELEEDCKQERERSPTQIEPWKQGRSIIKLDPCQHMLDRWDEEHFYGPLSQGKGLQVFKLERTSMKSLLDISVSWPQLSMEFELLQGHFQLIDYLRKRKPSMLGDTSLLAEGLHQCLVESTGLNGFSYLGAQNIWDCANMQKSSSPDISRILERPTCVIAHVLAGFAGFLRVLGKLSYTGCKFQMLCVLCNKKIIMSSATEFFSMQGTLDCQVGSTQMSLDRENCKTRQVGYILSHCAAVLGTSHLSGSSSHGFQHSANLKGLEASNTIKPGRLDSLVRLREPSLNERVVVIDVKSMIETSHTTWLRSLCTGRVVVKSNGLADNRDACLNERVVVDVKSMIETSHTTWLQSLCTGRVVVKSNGLQISNTSAILQVGYLSLHCTSVSGTSHLPGSQSHVLLKIENLKGIKALPYLNFSMECCWVSWAGSHTSNTMDIETVRLVEISDCHANSPQPPLHIKNGEETKQLLCKFSAGNLKGTNRPECRSLDLVKDHVTAIVVFEKPYEILEWPRPNNFEKCILAKEMYFDEVLGSIPKSCAPKKCILQLCQMIAPFVEAYLWLCIYRIQEGFTFGERIS